MGDLTMAYIPSRKSNSASPTLRIRFYIRIAVNTWATQRLEKNSSIIIECDLGVGIW